MFPNEFFNLSLSIKCEIKGRLIFDFLSRSHIVLTDVFKKNVFVSLIEFKKSIVSK